MPRQPTPSGCATTTPSRRDSPRPTPTAGTTSAWSATARWMPTGSTPTGRRDYTSKNGKNVNENHYGAKHTAASQGRHLLLGLPRPARRSAALHVPLRRRQFARQGCDDDITAYGTFYGVPAASRTVTGFDVTSGGGTALNFNSTDLVNTSFTGLCQTCHSTASYYNQSTVTALTATTAPMRDVAPPVTSTRGTSALPATAVTAIRR